MLLFNYSHAASPPPILVYLPTSLNVFIYRTTTLRSCASVVFVSTVTRIHWDWTTSFPRRCCTAGEATRRLHNFVEQFVASRVSRTSVFDLTETEPGEFSPSIG
ncbi:hypothetical protein CERSUDRAFT_101613 [Gelatoporia subvermispora B]|uniref:Uncharacterized protein n=1 Tax=Ceriporiopsis subvermispora (strain B) TaxID=914234 RepID=M2Q0A6_CERS8|nr:hypothetical protein CERSUDRAFT_101613 [Gelatoporia subvermispora B]